MKYPKSLFVGSVEIPFKLLQRHCLHESEITPEEIMREPNVEIRMVLISLYGLVRFMNDSNCRVIHSDPWYGDYIHLSISDDVNLYAIKLTNRTKEPNFKFSSGLSETGSISADGYKYYILFVPHGDFKSSKEAVAWTFGLNEHEYIPIIET